MTRIKHWLRTLWDWLLRRFATKATPKVVNPSDKNPLTDPESFITVPAGDEALPPPVFAAELKAVKARRHELGLPPPPGDTPSAALGLFGLALSGGGIRSATFNLGVVQALAKHGLFPYVDYLSTVSGGGYLGSALSALFAAAPPPENLVIVVSGVPDGAWFSAGTKRSDNRWELRRHELDGLKLFLAPGAGPATFNLTASAEIAPEDGSGPAETWTELPEVVIRPGALVPEHFTCSEHIHDRGRGLRVERSAAGADQETALLLHIHSEAFPFHHRAGALEGAAFRHLRDSSNYLVPKSFLAGLRLPALFLRGFIVNFLIILPLVLAAALGTLWITGGTVREALETEKVFIPLSADTPSPWLTAEEDGRHFTLDLKAGVAATAIGSNAPDSDHVALVDLPRGLTIDGKEVRQGQTLVYPLADVETVDILVSMAVPDSVVLELRLWRESNPGVVQTADPISDLHDHAFLWIRIGLVAVLGTLALYPLLQWFTSWRQPNWTSRDRVTRWVAGGAILAILAVVTVFLQPLAIYYFGVVGDMKVFGFGDLSEVSTLIWTAVTAIGALFSGAMAERSAGLAGRIGLKILGLMGPVIIWLVYLNLCRWALVPGTTPDWLIIASTTLGDAYQAWETDTPFFGVSPGMAVLELLTGFLGTIADALSEALSWAGDGSIWLRHTTDVCLLYGAAILFITFFTQFFYDVNATSFHRFYRDRLSKAYLFDVWRRDPNGKPRHNDDQLLSTLDCRRSPYHLINTTLNVQHSRKANLRGRNGAFFIMSKAYLGGQLIGYRRTEAMEALHPYLDLATAMAISGAAAAPNMGRNTQRGLTFAMTLLNVRLGYWLPHPHAYAGKLYRLPYLGPLMRQLVRPFLRVTPWHLLHEMLGQLNEEGWHVNLTDGGHLENLGLHELLRRRCKLIIACDAEADPKMKFQGLADAVRFAQMDLGITIDLDIDPIRPDPLTGMSAAHCAVGRINYGHGEVGHLLYIKSSLTGNENVYVEKYKAEEPTFPHQTTADQFFDEEQFEAYRALGYHAAESVLDGHATNDRLALSLDDFLAKLKGLHQKPLV